MVSLEGWFVGRLMVSLAGWIFVKFVVSLTGWFDGKLAARAFGRFSDRLVARPVGWFAGNLVVRLFGRFAEYDWWVSSLAKPEILSSKLFIYVFFTIGWNLCFNTEGLEKLNGVSGEAFLS
jgi:hypothetical protein